MADDEHGLTPSDQLGDQGGDCLGAAGARWGGDPQVAVARRCRHHGALVEVGVEHPNRGSPAEAGARDGAGAGSPASAATTS